MHCGLWLSAYTFSIAHSLISGLSLNCLFLTGMVGYWSRNCVDILSLNTYHKWCYKWHAIHVLLPSLIWATAAHRFSLLCYGNSRPSWFFPILLLWKNQQVPCSLNTEATISHYLQYTWNLIKDTSSLVYCLTMFDVCHMFSASDMCF